MEEYITRAEFEQFKKQMEQKTEEMKAIRVDVHNVDVEAIKQELYTVSETWLDTMQEHYTEHKQDITDVQTVQRGHSKYFEEHGKRLAATATKEDLAAMKNEILDTIKQLWQQRPLSSNDQEQ